MMNKKPEIYLERKFDAYLAEWKSRGDRLPLIIKGGAAGPVVRVSSAAFF